jgi:CheY-like chemotaxis protein
MRVLLLEDDINDAELVSMTLRRGGIDCMVVRVQTEDECLNARRHETFDRLLSDYRLPGFEGISALAHAQQERPDVPSSSSPVRWVRNSPSRPSSAARSTTS